MVKSGCEKACQTCLLVEIPISEVTEIDFTNGNISSILAVADGSSPFQLHTNMLQFWDGHAFVDVTPYTNVSLTVLSGCDRYVLELCPKSSTTAMTIDNYVGRPYFAFQDVIGVNKDGALVLAPDFLFHEPICSSCLEC